MKSKLTLPLVALLGLASASHAALLVTPFANANFETGAPASNSFAAGVADWAEGDVTLYGAAFVQGEDSNAAVPLDGLDGDADTTWAGIAYREDVDTAGPGELFQQFGTFTANESYDFTMNVGYRSDRGWGNLVVTLFTSNAGTGVADADSLDGTRSSVLAGYAVLDTFTYSTTPDTGDGDAIAFSLASGATGTAGNPIWASFSIENGSVGSGANQTFIDDISVAAVPEPSTYALIAGFLALGGVMLRRRLRR